MLIHPTAIIEDNVEIGPDCEIAAYAVVKRFTKLGARNRIFEHAVVGGEPQDVKFRGERSYLEIGDDNQVREFCTLHRASGEGETTRIGSRNFFMVGCHVAHNCSIGSDNIFANEVALAGHILVEEDRKSTRLNSSHSQISYAVFCLKKKKNQQQKILTHSYVSHIL